MIHSAKAWLQVVLCVAIVTCISNSSVIAKPIPGVASSLGKALLKHFGKEGSTQATEYLTKKGGQEILERVATNAAKQGGDEGLEQVAKFVSKHGPEALAALDNSPTIAPTLKAISELTEAQVKPALVKLAAGAPGRELAEATSRFGVAALRTELQHPGAGLVIVRALGNEGAELAAKLSTNQAVAIGRHADDIAKLPLAQRNQILSMVRKDTEKFFGFVGRFIDANPGKSLFTIAGTTVILAEPERILGGDEIVFDADGNPIVVRKAGLAGRTIAAGSDAAAHVSNQYIRPVFLAVMAFLGTFALLWSAIKLWHTHQREQAKTKAMLEADSKKATH